MPDTSPRGLNIEGDSESYDLGQSAGFYVDATVGVTCVCISWNILFVYSETTQH